MRYVSMARAMKASDGVLRREPKAVCAVEDCRIRASAAARFGWFLPPPRRR